MTASDSTPRLDLNQTPLAYPGDPVGSSLLLLPECTHRLTFRPGRRLGQARVERCDTCADREGSRIVPLNYELLRWNVANIDSRFAVVAVGSNANADVLRGKMSRAGVDPIIPLVRARLDNLIVSHSAHVGRPGFIPAAPARDDGGFCEIVVGFLDRDQLKHMDNTEPNYVRRLLDGDGYPLTLDGGERIAGFHIYDSKWGLLANGSHALPLDTQVEVSSWLADRGLAPWVDHEAAEAAAILASDVSLRDELRDLFADRSLSSQVRQSFQVFCSSAVGWLIQLWLGILGGWGRRAKRSGWAWRAASRVVWRASSMAPVVP